MGRVSRFALKYFSKEENTLSKFGKTLITVQFKYGFMEVVILFSPLFREFSCIENTPANFTT